MAYPNPFPLFIPAILWLMTGPFYIRFLKAKMLGQFIREDGPQGHQAKTGTPTMGGLLIVVSILLSLLGFVLTRPQLATPELGWVVLTLVVFCALGFSDDYLKVAKKKNKGLSGWSKLAIQTVLSLAVGWWAMAYHGGGNVSVFNLFTLSLGWFYPLLVWFIITGASNAYNLTDGLDGLAGGTGFATFVGFAFLLGQQPSLMLASLLIAGACLGFLVFNRHPAQIFMGDTGSLALGGVMGVLAVLTGTESFLLLLGGLYIIETLSVILQVGYFKLTGGKRLFRMSPLHHHFELLGWKEPTIVLTFTLLQALLSVLAVILYSSRQGV